MTIAALKRSINEGDILKVVSSSNKSNKARAFLVGKEFLVSKKRSTFFILEYAENPFYNTTFYWPSRKNLLEIDEKGFTIDYCKTVYRFEYVNL